MRQRKQPLRTSIAGFLEEISELHVTLSNADVVTAKRLFKSCKASPGVGEVVRPRNGGNFAVAKLDEMLGGKLGASAVIDDNGIYVHQARLSIQVDQDRPGFLECAQEIQVRSGGAIDDPGHLPAQ